MQDWTTGTPRLVLEFCAACGHRWYFARPWCPWCAEPEPERRTAVGRGRLLAVTTVRHALADAMPFALGLVELDERVQVLGHCDRNAMPSERVRLQFHADPPIPYFATDRSATP